MGLPLHGIGSRQDLPLPFEWVLVGAVVALVVTFGVLALRWRTPRLAGVEGRRLRWLTRIARSPIIVWTARLVVLAFWGWFTFALVAGQDRVTNPVFGIVFVLVWTGLVPFSVLFPGVWQALHPVRWLASLMRRPPLRLGSGVGVWPAAVGIAAFTWFELVQPDRATLPVLRGWVVAWVLVVVGGALVFGPRWVGAADPFDAASATVSKLGAIQPTGSQIRLVNPLRALVNWRPPSGTAALLLVMIGGTAFDSASSGAGWVRWVQSSPMPAWVWGTAGLAGTIAVVAAAYLVACRAMAPALRHRRRLMAIADAMSVGLVPIAVGYSLAHYLTLLVIEGQRTIIQLSDPLGRGWNVLGTAEAGVSVTVLSYPPVTALLQVSFIVVGHLAAVVAAHEKTLMLVRRHEQVRAQIPMLLVMVGFTIAGLLLLFAR